MRGAFDVYSFACGDVVIAVAATDKSKVGKNIMMFRPCVFCGDAGNVNGGLVVSELPGGCAAGFTYGGAQCTEGVYHADVGGG